MCLSRASWELGRGEAVIPRWAGRSWERLQAGMAGGAGGLFAPGGFSPLCGQGDRREGERAPPLWKKRKKREKEKRGT